MHYTVTNVRDQARVAQLVSCRLAVPAIQIETPPRTKECKKCIVLIGLVFIYIPDLAKINGTSIK